MGSKLWILVRVERGFPASLTFFRREADALAEREKSAREINRDYDEVELFDVDLDQFSHHRKFTVKAK